MESQECFERLIGKWKMLWFGHEVTLTLNRDGSCQSRYLSPDGSVKLADGKWTVDGVTLNVDLQYSSPKLRAQSKDAFIIKKVDHSQLVLKQLHKDIPHDEFETYERLQPE